MTRLSATVPFILLAAAAISAEQRPFDLYQPIIDRAPFGKLPPDFDPTANPTAQKSGSAAGDAEAQLTKDELELQKSVNATALVVDSARNIWIGFTDTTDPKSPRNHYVPVGSSEDGWLVKAADQATKTVTFVKDGISIDVVVGREGSKGPVPGSAKEGAPAETPNAAGGGRARSPLLSRSRSDGEDAAPASRRSLKQMRREKEAAEAAERSAALEAALAEAKRQREEEAAKRAEEEAEREAERAAEREEYRERLKNLAADIEKRMEKNRATESDEENEEEAEQ